MFQINMDDPEGNKTFFVKKGEKLEKAWEVGEFRLQVRKKTNPTTGLVEERNESELDLISSRGEKITLIKNTRLDSDKSRAHFVSLIRGDKRFESRVGQVFVFHGKSYLLLDVNDQRAVVRDMGTNGEFVVRLATERERAGL